MTPPELGKHIIMVFQRSSEWRIALSKENYQVLYLVWLKSEGERGLVRSFPRYDMRSAVKGVVPEYHGAEGVLNSFGILTSKRT